MALNDLAALFRDRKEEDLSETDETLALIEEMKQMECRHRQILEISSDLQDAYFQLLQKKRSL